MPKNITNKTTRADRIRKVKAGLAKYYATTPLVLAGTSYQPAGLQAFLQADIDANDASTQSRATWLNTVKTAKSQDSATNLVLRSIEAQVKAQYGEAPDADKVLADFGYAPRKKPTPTAQTKAEAAAKAKATREARHTMGPKAKAKIHGVAPAVVAEPPQPAVNPTPAPVVTSSSSSASSAGASPSGATNPSHS